MLIGEVAQRSGISARMLRHYDRLGLVRPSTRAASGYREYAETDLRRLFDVEGLRSLGLTLAEIADVLDDRGYDPGRLVAELIAGTEQRIAREHELLRRLRLVRASDPEAWSDALRTVEMLRGLDAGDPRARQRFALSLTDPDAAALAEVVLDEPEANVGGTLDWALTRTGDAGIAVLVEALDGTDPERRERAVRALVKIGSPAALAALAEAVEHPDPQVRTEAVLARGRLGATDAIEPLTDLVAAGRRDVDAADRLAALATDDHRGNAVVVAITAALAQANAPARRRLVAALADIPGDAARNAIARAANDPDRGVAHTAAYLLQRR